MIYKINAILLSFLMALFPAYVFAGAALAIPPTWNVASVTTTTRIGVAANDVLISNGTTTASSRMAVRMTAAAAGAWITALVTAGAAGYYVGTKLNNTLGISDYISDALSPTGITCNTSGCKQAWQSCSLTCDNDLSKIYQSSAGNFANGKSACNAVFAQYGEQCTSIKSRTATEITYQVTHNGQNSRTSIVYIAPRPGFVPPAATPATEESVGNAIIANENAKRELSATVAMNEAALQQTEIENCTLIGGTQDLNTGSCGVGLNAQTGQPVTQPETPEEYLARQKLEADAAAAELARTNLAQKEQQAAQTAQDAANNPSDQAKQDAANKAKQELAEAQAKATAANTAQTATATTNATKPNYPVFCTWATTVCGFIIWAKEQVNDDIPQKEAIDTSVSPPITPQTVNLNFGQQCPATISVPIEIEGIQKNITLINFEYMCSQAPFMKLAIIGMASIRAAFIVFGSKGD